MSVQRSKQSHTKETVGSELYNERICFEADRTALVQELKAVGSALEDGASEMAMTAAESVFDEKVSKILTDEARAINRMVRGLKELRLAVARARLPKPGK
jgi:hypothetical protein